MERLLLYSNKLSRKIFSRFSRMFIYLRKFVLENFQFFFFVLFFLLLFFFFLFRFHEFLPWQKILSRRLLRIKYATTKIGFLYEFCLEIACYTEQGMVFPSGEYQVGKQRKINCDRSVLLGVEDYWDCLPISNRLFQVG